MKKELIKYLLVQTVKYVVITSIMGLTMAGGSISRAMLISMFRKIPR